MFALLSVHIAQHLHQARKGNLSRGERCWTRLVTQFRSIRLNILYSGGKTFSLIPSVIDDHGIIVVDRFRDDIIFASSLPLWDPTACACFRKMERTAATVGWKFKYAEASLSVQYLDVKFSVRRGRLEFLPYMKPNFAASVPLAPSSAHHPSVHATWPSSRLQQLLSLGGHESRASTMQNFLQRFRRHCVPAPPALARPLSRKIRQHASQKIKTSSGSECSTTRNGTASSLVLSSGFLTSQHS